MPNLQDWHESIELEAKSAANPRGSFRRQSEKNSGSRQQKPSGHPKRKALSGVVTDLDITSKLGGKAKIVLRPAISEPRRGRGPRKNETREELLERLLDPTLTLDETARMLEVCPTTVRRYTNRGILQHERSKGNQRRFKLSCVLAFMELQSRDLPKIDK